MDGRILSGSTLCTDAHISHEKLAEQLNVTLKELVTTSGQYVREKIYHIQTVNAYHSELKCWINGFFKGVATKYLSRYLGWKRFLKTHIFSEESLNQHSYTCNDKACNDKACTEYYGYQY